MLPALRKPPMFACVTFDPTLLGLSFNTLLCTQSHTQVPVHAHASRPSTLGWFIPCSAARRCKCLTLSRDAFERLMGPVEQSLAQQIAAYAQSNAKASAVAAAAAGVLTDAAAAGGTRDKGGAAAPVRQRIPTPPPAHVHGGSGMGPPAHACCAAGSATSLLPGSPRPHGYSSDQSGHGWRRSRRGTGSEAGDNPGTQCSAPLSPLLTSHEAPHAAPESAGARGEAPAGHEAEPLPTIAEETTLDAAGAAAAAAAAAEFAAAADAQERAAAARAVVKGSSKAAPRTKTLAAVAGGSKPAAAKKRASVKKKPLGR